MARQASAQLQVFFVDPGHRMFAQQCQRLLGADLGHSGGDLVVSMVSGSWLARPSSTAVSQPWPTPVAASEPYSSAVTWCTAAKPWLSRRWQANCRAAIMGPTVWELEGLDADFEKDRRR